LLNNLFAVQLLQGFLADGVCLQTNCLTEIFVDRALSRAKELDAHLRNAGKVVGPLHGLPISLKDQFSMKGLETIMGEFKLCKSATLLDPVFPGYASWIGDYAEYDCALVEILYHCGAVPFVRTNVPQTLIVCLHFLHVTLHSLVNVSGVRRTTMCSDGRQILTTYNAPLEGHQAVKVHY
jgi:hypothetical protein